MSSISHVAILLAATLLSSCAAVSHKFTCPAKGGVEWRELKSEHVLLQTDLSQAKAEELLRDAEQMRALVLAALFKQPPQLPDRVHLVAFRTDRELWELTGEAGRNTVATFAMGMENRSADPFLAVVPAWGRLRSDYLSSLTHAISWQVSGYLFPGQPDWLREGLATYMETLALYDDGGRHFVGNLPGAIVGPPWEVPDTLSITLAGGTPAYGNFGLRSPGWMLVRWLSEARPAEYVTFLKQVSSGVDGKAAWMAVFPQWDPARPDQMALLEAELKAWFDIGKLRYREVTAAVDPTWRSGSLAAPEVHLLRIRIRREARGATGAAENAAEAAEAIAEAPLHPAALWLAAGEKAIDPATARASTGAYPDDWRAWLLLGEALQGRDAVAAVSAFRKAGALAPGDPVALLGVARGLLAIDDAPAALPRAREAVRLAPSSDEALAVLAAAAAQTGSCPEALVTARRLRARLKAGDDPRAEKLLEQVASRCLAGGPTGLR